MNLTIEQVSKATKLSVSTIRVYASQRNLGKKVGGKRIFSQADVKLLLKGSKPSAKKPSKRTTRRPVKKAAEAKAIRVEKPKGIPSTHSSAIAKPEKPSFWSRLFGNKGTPKKVGLMDAKVTK